MVQSRWKSKVLWAALAAQAIGILVLVGVIDAGFGETANQVVALGLQILVIVGVVNDPKDPVNW